MRQFYSWIENVKKVAVCLLQPPEEHDPQSQLHLEREWRFERNSRVRREAAKQQAKTGKQTSQPKNSASVPCLIWPAITFEWLYCSVGGTAHWYQENYGFKCLSGFIVFQAKSNGL